MPASSRPHAISQCASVGTATLAASMRPISSRQFVVQSVSLSLLMERAVSSFRSQTATNCETPSAASVGVNASVLPAETANSDDCCA